MTKTLFLVLALSCAVFAQSKRLPNTNQLKQHSKNLVELDHALVKQILKIGTSDINDEFIEESSYQLDTLKQDYHKLQIKQFGYEYPNDAVLRMATIDSLTLHLGEAKGAGLKGFDFIEKVGINDSTKLHNKFLDDYIIKDVNDSTSIKEIFKIENLKSTPK